MCQQTSPHVYYGAGGSQRGRFSSDSWQRPLLMYVAKTPLSKTYAKCDPGRKLVEERNIVIDVWTGINSSTTASADASNFNTKVITSYLGDC